MLLAAMQKYDSLNIVSAWFQAIPAHVAGWKSQARSHRIGAVAAAVAASGVGGPAVTAGGRPLATADSNAVSSAFLFVVASGGLHAVALQLAPTAGNNS